MRLLIIRHAIAWPHGTPGIPEDDRPLTRKGTRRFRRGARGLARIVSRPDLLLSSPLPRAWQTAEIAAKAWGRLAPTSEPALASGDVDQIVEAIERRRRQASVAVVGHEPTLSGLLARLLRCEASDRLTLGKGGAALVDLPDGPRAGGQLVWYLRPRLLRELGES